MGAPAGLDHLDGNPTCLPPVTRTSSIAQSGLRQPAPPPSPEYGAAMFDRRSLVVVGLALVVGLSACSGGDPAALPDTSGGVAESQPTETDSVAGPGGGFDAAVADQIERAASAALEQFVDLPMAGTAIVIAYDNGFSFAQIVGALDT